MEFVAQTVYCYERPGYLYPQSSMKKDRPGSPNLMPENDTFPLVETLNMHSLMLSFIPPQILDTYLLYLLFQYSHEQNILTPKQNILVGEDDLRYVGDEVFFSL